MIVFAPAHDDETRACAVLAIHVAGHTNSHLLHGSDARRGPLLSALGSANFSACMFFAHGDDLGIYSANDERSLNRADLGGLPKKPLYAYACHSAQFFQEAADRQRVTWGYDKSMLPPPFGAIKRADAESVFRFIAHHFASCASLDDVHKVIDELRDTCLKQVGQYKNSGLANVSSMVFFMQIWSRLRVFTPWHPQPVKHRDSWKADLDDLV